VCATPEDDEIKKRDILEWLQLRFPDARYFGYINETEK